MSDLDATAALARADGGHPGKLALTGCGWGRRITRLYAAQPPNLTTGVAWHGRLVGAPGETPPKHPVDLTAAKDGWQRLQDRFRKSGMAACSRQLRPKRPAPALRPP